MRGTVFTMFMKFKRADCHDKSILDLEKTRYRKKPRGGSRYLLDPKQIYNFNAWYGKVRLFQIIS